MVPQKKRGPPSRGGPGVQIQVRLQAEPLAALDTWRAEQPQEGDEVLTRPEAVRRLVDKALGRDDEPKR
jgi:hypothetical protein